MSIIYPPLVDLSLILEVRQAEPKPNSALSALRLLGLGNTYSVQERLASATSNAVLECLVSGGILLATAEVDSRLAALLIDSKNFCGNWSHFASLSTSDFARDEIRL